MNKIRNILFAGILLALATPMLQYTIGFIKTPPLYGAFNAANDTMLSINGWISGEFQSKKEKYLNENFGFRVFCVRINNQIDFSLFNKANTFGVEIGKENFLYEKEYISAYLGNDIVDAEELHKKLLKLKFLQDTLRKKNKSLILIIAAGKASFYPEYFPEKYNDSKKKQSNYNSLINAARKLKINHIDFNQYFIQNKNKSKYPLYSKHGIHWSAYGSFLAADSIIKHIEKENNIDLPDFYVKELQIKEEDGIDYDLGAGLNLLINLKKDSMAYPHVITGSSKNKTRPGLIVVGDSYYFNLLQHRFDQCFSNHQFWYYNKNVMMKDNKNESSSKMDLTKTLDEHDIIIIMATERNLSDLGWGYIERMYEHFK
jgi:hypothetical protein